MPFYGLLLRSHDLTIVKKKILVGFSQILFRYIPKNFPQARALWEFLQEWLKQRFGVFLVVGLSLGFIISSKN
tara:strand:- start:1018 stop:1236 length:219 start_codon:yes stop_codon:yes gene_type:complete